MASTIKIRRSSTPGSIPTNGGLSAGELAINIADRRLYSSNGTHTFQVDAQPALGNTNSFIATKVNTTTFNSALANTNSFIRSQLANTNSAISNVKTGLTSTNTALRTLISDRLQVANAATIYQTKATERAALANTNSAISNVKTGLTSTNTALRTLISDRLQVANAATLYTTKSNPTTSGLLAHTGRATISTNLAVTGNTSTNKSIVTSRLDASAANTIIGGLSANGSFGTDGYVLKTNGSTAFWGIAGSAGAITASSTDTLTNKTFDTAGTGNVFRINGTGITAVTGTGAVVLATSPTLTTPTLSGLASATGRLTVGTNLSVSGNTTIGGNLTVSGTLTYIDSTTISIGDNMIKLGNNNIADSIDLGLYQSYTSSGKKYTGMIRDASDGIYKFFYDLAAEPDQTINFGNSTQATIEATIDGGTY